MNDSFDPIIESAAAKWGVPFAWIKAVIGTESNFDAYAYREEPRISDASYGLMQLLTKTARGLGFSGWEDDLYNPEINIDYGTKLLAQLRSRYGSDFKRIYSAYNSGSPDKWETSSQVAHNVARAEEWLAQVIEDHPEAVLAAGGGAAILLLGVAVWFFMKRGRF